MNFCEAFWFIFRKKYFFSTHRNDSWSKRCFPRLYLSKYKNVEGKNYLLLSWGVASSVALPMPCSLMLPYPGGPAPARGWQCKGLAMPLQRPGGEKCSWASSSLLCVTGPCTRKAMAGKRWSHRRSHFWYRLKKGEVGLWTREQVALRIPYINWPVRTTSFLQWKPGNAR